MNKFVNPNIGHRSRLKQKFINFEEALYDYEILELLLYYAIPRKNVQPLAKFLIHHFGSLKQVLSASFTELQQILGLTPHSITLLKLSFSLSKKILKREVINNSVVNNWNQLLDYCFLKLSNNIYEQFYILYINSKNIIIKEELLLEGSLTNVTVDVRKIVHRSLSLGATTIVIAHNHPGGSLQPSKQDIEATKNLLNVAKSLNIFLYDHLIISKQGIYSFRQHNLI